ncbi:hypothetical protein BCV70DRAFT_87421 [Testicularia cyperi]|uniref:Uncharacterized protein n=1 Tax=Testicularia cyperi TaxID=1882483 RepID=A0A317XRQ7_9BASI|nr:hypothetical protein BCV70DRAFT_87421 [Testicularia cyperi]
MCRTEQRAKTGTQLGGAKSGSNFSPRNSTKNLHSKNLGTSTYRRPQPRGCTSVTVRQATEASAVQVSLNSSLRLSLAEWSNTRSPSCQGDGDLCGIPARSYCTLSTADLKPGCSTAGGRRPSTLTRPETVQDGQTCVQMVPRKCGHRKQCRTA